VKKWREIILNHPIRVLLFIAGFILLLVPWSVSAACSDKNEAACNDQVALENLMRAAEGIWIFNRLMLMLARVLEWVREWFVNEVGRPIIDIVVMSVSTPFWIIAAFAWILLVIGFFARPIVDMRWVDVRRGLPYVILSMIIFAWGGAALAELDQVRINLGNWAAGIARDTGESETVNFVDEHDQDPPSLSILPETIEPLYTEDAICPEGAVLPGELDDTVTPDEGNEGQLPSKPEGWSLSRRITTTVFLSDYAARYLWADVHDVWCPTITGDKPALPIDFAGTSTVEPDVRSRRQDYYVYTDVNGGQFSIFGPPTISPQTLERIVCQPRSAAGGGPPPMCPQSNEVYQTLVDANIDPVMWAGFAAKESQFGATPPGPDPQYNPHGVVCNAADGSRCCSDCPGPQWARRFAYYENFSHSVDAWAGLMHRVYAAQGMITPAQILPVYAPAFENDTQLYIDQLQNWATIWRGWEGDTPVAQPPSNPAPSQPVDDPDELPDQSEVDAAEAAEEARPPGAFPGYFPYSRIDHMQTERRVRILGEGGTGVLRMMMGIFLTITGVLEQFTHLLFTIALFLVWLSLVFSTLFVLFTPTDYMFKRMLRELVAVFKASLLASVWIGLAVLVLEQAATNNNAILMGGVGIIAIFIMGWQVMYALKTLLNAGGATLAAMGTSPSVLRSALGGLALAAAAAATSGMAIKAVKGLDMATGGKASKAIHGEGQGDQDAQASSQGSADNAQASASAGAGDGSSGARDSQAPLQVRARYRYQQRQRELNDLQAEEDGEDEEENDTRS